MVEVIEILPVPVAAPIVLPVVVPIFTVPPKTLIPEKIPGAKVAPLVVESVMAAIVLP